MRTAPTPEHLRETPSGSAYFIWDTVVSWDEFVRRLRSEDQELADYWLARGLRDAKPDDMLELVTLSEIARAWPRIARRTGRRRAFWSWLLERTGHAVDA